MSSALGYGFRPSVAILSFLAALITLYLLPNAYQPRGHDLYHTVQISTQQSNQEHKSKIGVPFGLNEYTHNFTAANRSSTLAKREIDYDRLVCKGRMLLNMILHGQPVGYSWSPEALKNGWTWQRNVLGAPPEELLGALGKLGVPTDVHSVHSIYLNQDKPFMDSFGILNNVSVHTCTTHSPPFFHHHFSKVTLNHPQYLQREQLHPPDTNQPRPQPKVSTSTPSSPPAAPSSPNPTSPPNTKPGSVPVAAIPHSGAGPTSYGSSGPTKPESSARQTCATSSAPTSSRPKRASSSNISRWRKKINCTYRGPAIRTI